MTMLETESSRLVGDTSFQSRADGQSQREQTRPVESFERKRSSRTIITGVFQRLSTRRDSLVEDAYNDRSFESISPDLSLEAEDLAPPLEPPAVHLISMEPTIEELWKRIQATRIQACFRRYLLSTKYRIFCLEKKLKSIRTLRNKQLKKIEERKAIRKRTEKTRFEFQDDQKLRKVQRHTRIIQYLFRENQKELAANLELIAQQNGSIDGEMVQKLGSEIGFLNDTNFRLKKLAHEYVETLDSIEGIWDLIIQKWMGPKKPRPRRVFVDGKKKTVTRVAPTACSNAIENETVELLDVESAHELISATLISQLN